MDKNFHQVRLMEETIEADGQKYERTDQVTDRLWTKGSC